MPKLPVIIISSRWIFNFVSLFHRFWIATLMPPRRASKKASALTLGEEAQPPSGIPKGKKQQQPPGAGPDNVAAVTNTMSVDVVVNDPSTGGGLKAA